MSSKTNEKKTKKNIQSKQKITDRSIAVQLSLERIFYQLFTSILFDIVLIIVSLVAFCFCEIKKYVPNGFTLKAFGGLTMSRDSSVFSENLRTMALHFTDSLGVEKTVSAGDFAVFMYYTVIVLLIIEAAAFLISCVRVPLKITKRLKPLYTMAEAAKALTNTDFSTDEYTTLQDAINNLSPSSPDQKLHTGKTELAGLESAINDLMERMRSSYKSQIRFVSDASHELRTPIAVIQGYANMLDRWGREDPEILHESITAIKGEADNMNRLVENLLFLARGDSGKTNLRIENVSINQLLCDIYDEFVMIDANHEFLLDLRAEVNADVDMSLIKQCMRILIDNAIKYSSSGSDIIIRLQSRNSGRYSIEIQDYGIGVKQEDADKIFERFYRSDPARSRQTGGSGLGLSIAKWIAEKHEGYIELLSYEDLGTRLSLVLPYKLKAASEQSD